MGTERLKHFFVLQPIRVSLLLNISENIFNRGEHLMVQCEGLNVEIFDCLHFTVDIVHKKGSKLKLFLVCKHFFLI